MQAPMEMSVEAAERMQAILADKDKRIAELERKLATQEQLVMVYQAIGRQELGDELFEQTARARIAEIEQK